MSSDNSNRNDKTYPPGLVVTTVLIFLVVFVLGVFLFIMRSRAQGRWMIREQELRWEWVRKMNELGIGVQVPTLYEVVLGAKKAADPWGRDLAKKFNGRTWNEFTVCSLCMETPVNKD